MRRMSGKTGERSGMEVKKNRVGGVSPQWGELGKVVSRRLRFWYNLLVY